MAGCIETKEYQDDEFFVWLSDALDILTNNYLNETTKALKDYDYDYLQEISENGIIYCDEVLSKIDDYYLSSKAENIRYHAKRLVYYTKQAFYYTKLYSIDRDISNLELSNQYLKQGLSEFKIVNSYLRDYYRTN